MNKQKWLIAGLSLAMAASLGVGLSACSVGKKPDTPTEHTHTYDAWDHDDTQHWKYCDEHGNDKSNIDESTKANHDFTKGDCECGAKKPSTQPEHTHTYDAWDHDATQHWKYCDEHGNDKSNIDESTKANHDYKDGVCECGAKEPVTADEWTIDENGTVTAWGGTGTELTLPKTVGEVEVKKISADAFKNNENAAKITKLIVGVLPTSFGGFLESGALDPLTGCTEVVYNEDFEAVVNSPIYNQKTFLARIKKVTFLENVVNTPQYGCAYMTNLESVEFKGEVKTFRGNLFDSCGLKEITIPASLDNFITDAFNNMTKLETINYAMVKGHFMRFKQTNQMHPFDDKTGSEAPNGVKLIITDPAATIGEYTFYGFTHLKSVQWHEDGMGQIGSRAFAKSGITSLTIPANFTEDTFNKMNSSGCSFQEMESLETLTFEPDPQYHVLPSNSFLGCTSLRKLVLPEGITGFTSWTFRRCTALREVVLPSTLTKLSYQAFFEDTLDSLTIKKTDGVLPFSPNTAEKAGMTFSENGKIYVPADLVDEYKADDNWKLLADYIAAAPEVDPEAEVDVNWYIKGTEEPVHTQKVKQGSELAEADAYQPEAKEGYTFYGWYSDAACTQKVDFPVSVLEAKNFYGEYREDIVLDERDYFLVGSGQGTIKASNWALGASAPASCKFTRVPGTNTYELKNFELMVGDQMKLGFAGTWGTDSAYAFGAYFFSKYSDVFVKSTAWGDNATVADGKSGKYNITLVTKGANKATTTKAENQIVSFTFECIESYNVTTEDMGWYLTGTMNGWNATAPNASYKLTDEDGDGIWEGTFTFASAYTMKAIHFTKTTKGATVSYAPKWSNDGDHATPKGTVKMSYNSKTDKLTHTVVTAAAAFLQSMPNEVVMLPEKKD